MTRYAVVSMRPDLLSGRLSRLKKILFRLMSADDWRYVLRADRVYLCDTRAFAEQERDWEEKKGLVSCIVEVDDPLPHVVEWTSEQYRKLMEMNDMVNRIAEYIRRTYSREISAGEHEGMTLDQVVIRYLRRERRCAGVEEAGEEP